MFLQPHQGDQPKQDQNDHRSGLHRAEQRCRRQKRERHQPENKIPAPQHPGKGKSQQPTEERHLPRDQRCSEAQHIEERSQADVARACAHNLNPYPNQQYSHLNSKYRPSGGIVEGKSFHGLLHQQPSPNAGAHQIEPRPRTSEQRRHRDEYSPSGIAQIAAPAPAQQHSQRHPKQNQRKQKVKIVDAHNGYR